MTDRDRLIELLENCIEENVGVNDPNVSFEVDYENIADHLLANGVIVPPCKVGDKIYQTNGVRIYESTINEITFYTHKKVFVTENIAFDETAIGKSIFLTKEEAEQKLKELNNGTL